MWLVNFLWSLNAAVALILAGVCALAWIVDRRDIAKLMFCLTAIGTAAAIPFELGMMQATTAAELGEQIRWYHLPIFFVLMGQMLFVRFYLGTGRLWLLWMIVPIRVFVLCANFLVQPNFNFQEIASLRQISFLGGQVSVVGEGTPRDWQWLAAASMLLLVVFVTDATIQAWRQGGVESRRKAATMGLAMLLPMMGNLTLNQLVVSGVVHVPICATLWFFGTLTVIAFELGRDIVMNAKARLQLADLRRQWAQVERANSLGQLASSIAHELGHPLAASRINLEVAKMHIRATTSTLDELHSIIDDLQKDNLRAIEIIMRMREFIKGRGMTMQAFPLDEAVRDVLALLRYEATSRRVQIEHLVPRDLPSIRGDRVHVSQVILNLLINGMEAVKDRPVAERRVTLEVLPSKGALVEMTVRDTGPGIPADRFEAIFNPLYTTKPEGLGVGLALSRMIVKEHGGRIWVENGQTGGAIFHFTLPRESVTEERMGAEC